MESKWTDRDIKEIKPKLYHGHTVIELKDVRNGRRERIEHDNDFTDGIEQFLTSGGYFANNPYVNADWRGVDRWHRLIGGIFLFDKVIEQDENNNYPLYMPAGTKMTANGAYNVSNNATPELGSFNAAESQFSNNAHTYVYDWSTSQGNGTINSVCLTSDVGGYIGYGNPSGQYVTAKSLTTLQTSNNFSLESNYRAVIIDGTVWSAQNRPTSTLWVKRLDCPMETLSLFDRYGVINVVLPSGFEEASYNLTIPAPGVGFAVIKLTTNNYRVDRGGSTTIAIYDIKNRQLTTKTVSNPEDTYIGLVNAVLVGNNLTNVTIGSSTTRRIHLPLTGGHSFAEFENSAGGNSVVPLGTNDLFLARGAYGSNVSAWDGENLTAYPTNGSLGIGFSSSEGINVIYESTNIARYRNPLYLATVNNLDNEVTKTSQFNMKVTYIVTREE